MKHKVSDLEGALLDAAVANVLGLQFHMLPVRTGEVWGRVGHGPFLQDGAKDFSPSTDWSIGGPIIERERLYLRPPEVVGDYGQWTAFATGSVDGWTGPTPLIAAMRAYVASKFGDEVELP